jgi:hypothetical protein
MENIIFIGIGIVIVLIFLGSMSIVHIRTMRDDLNTRWYNLADKLQYRQDLIPNLIETIRLHIPDNKKNEYEKIIEQSIRTREEAGKNAFSGAGKITIEHSLSGNIKQLLDLAVENRELAQNTNFLELRKEFKEISKEIEEISGDYNNKVRHHNRSITKAYNLVPVLLMRYSKKKIFEFE